MFWKLIMISGTCLGSFSLVMSLFSVASHANANKQNVRYAEVDSATQKAKYAPRGLVGTLGATDASLLPATQGNRLGFPTNQLLVERGIQEEVARLIFKFESNSNLPQTYYVARSSENFETVFHYYCHTQGNIEIAWRGRGSGEGGCDGFTLGKTKYSTNKQVRQQEKRPVTTFCSAVAESGAWGAVVSNSPWDLLSPNNDPCREAIRRCELNSASSPCSVTNLGEKYPRKVGEQLTGVLVCDKKESLLSDPPRTRETLSKLDNWVEEKAVSEPLNSSSCSLHVINSEEILVVPTSEKITVIAAGDDILPPTNYSIVALAGKVRLIGSDPDLAPVSLVAGEICGNFTPPVALSRSKQVRERGEETAIPMCEEKLNLLQFGREIRQPIYDSPAVQTFLQGWETPEVQQDITQNYQPEIERQFLLGE